MHTYVTPQPVTLDGFQAILKAGEWGYKLSALVKGDLIKDLEEERESALEWARSKAKNPRRVTVKPEPWEELQTQKGTYQLRFTWKDGDKFFPVRNASQPFVVTEVATQIANSHTLFPYSKNMRSTQCEQYISCSQKVFGGRCYTNKIKDTQNPRILTLHNELRSTSSKLKSTFLL